MSESSSPSQADAADRWLWLEEVDGAKALDWVREHNARARAALETRPGFEALRAELLEVLDSKARIPSVGRSGAWLYNFWQDADHKRGLWRRTTLDEYRRAEPAWDVLLDIDALAAAEGENWVFGGAQVLAPDGVRSLVSLSRGGADAAVVREFDLASRRFVEGGFSIPEAKSSVEWLDGDTLLVGTDFGEGSLTASGYPRVIRRWRRGTPLETAETLFEAAADDVYAFASVDRTPGHERTVLGRATDFYNTEQFLWQAGALRPIAKPSDATIAFWRDRVLVELRSDWPIGGRSWPRGSLLVGEADALLGGELRFEALFTPTDTRSLAGFATTCDAVLLAVLDNVASRLEEWRCADGAWRRREVAAPFPGTLAAQPLHDAFVADDPLAEHYLMSYADFLTPDSLMLCETGSDERESLKARPRFFDAGGMRAEQRFAASRDGTRVPYFVVWPSEAASGDGLSQGPRPTLLTGYGGFEVPLQPGYSGAIGRAWLSRGGVYVVANLRGGGEFGPAWHQAATREGKQRSYDDFIAVAEALVADGVTVQTQLGIVGGSNGGLLVAAAMVQRPQLFGAVVCQVPLLDMRRYHRLLAGASWMAEYGDPDDPGDWAFIGRYSPYQNVSRNPAYPLPLFTTSTRDDRVHPGHARKMAAEMERLGHPLLYFENIEGGHGGAADNAQRADMLALEFGYLWMRLAAEEHRNG